MCPLHPSFPTRILSLNYEMSEAMLKVLPVQPTSALLFAAVFSIKVPLFILITTASVSFANVKK